MQVGPMYLKDRGVMTIAEEESMRGCYVVYCHVCVVCVILVYGPPLPHLHLCIFLIIFICIQLYMHIKRWRTSSFTTH